MIGMRRSFIVTLLALAASACGPTVREPIVVSDAWSNATPDGATVGGAYMEITAAEADTLLSATSTVADHIEMHTSSEENGMMRMRPLATVSLEPGKPFKFEPGGAHFMLMGLQQPLAVGLRYPITLQFEKAGARTVEVLVVEPGTR